jgi:hypothetical protein
MIIRAGRFDDGQPSQTERKSAGQTEEKIRTHEVIKTVHILSLTYCTDGRRNSYVRRLRKASPENTLNVHERRSA